MRLSNIVGCNMVGIGRNIANCSKNPSRLADTPHVVCLISGFVPTSVWVDTHCAIIVITCNTKCGGVLPASRL